MSHALPIDLRLPLDRALTALLARRGAALGVPEELCAAQYSNKGSQFQCNGALAAARALKRAPRQLAEEWAASLSAEERALFSTLEVAGPGFINLSLSDEVLAARSALALADERLCVPRVASPERVYIDFGGYNVAKQLHIGHLRSTIIGDTLQRVLRFVGDEVVSDVHLGDWGTQMGMLIEAVREERPGLPYFEDAAPAGGFPAESPLSLADMNRLYPAASGRAKEDEAFRARASLATAELQRGHVGYRALWRHFVALSVAEVRHDIAPFGVEFDLWCGESDAQPLIPELVARLQAEGRAELSEGAWIVPIADERGEPMVPLMLLKRDGGATYHTSDLATVVMRVREGADRASTVVDARQEMHFRQVFAAAAQTSLGARARGGVLALEHVKFGTINGADGRPFKTRSGDTVKLRDVVEMAVEAARARLEEGGLLADADEETRASVAQAVAVAAIKFGDLSNHRASDYVLNLSDFCSFEGKTGPYLLYAAVRVKSILSKAAERGLAAGPVVLRGEHDRALALALSRLPGVVAQVHAKKTPHLLCEYLFELSQDWSAFYQHCNIVREEDEAQRAGWLSLAALCLKTLTTGLGLLGVEVPERM